MDIEAIKTDADYEWALQEIELLFDAAPDTPEAERLEFLTTLVEAYDDEHFNLPAPDPMERILYYNESRGISGTQP